MLLYNSTKVIRFTNMDILTNASITSTALVRVSTALVCVSRTS